MESEKDSTPRKGGRKKKDIEQKKHGHPVYATNSEWAKIEELAAMAGMEVSPFIISKALS